MKKSLAFIALATVIATPVFAHGYSYNQPSRNTSLVSALVGIGNHNSVADVKATVGNRNSLADVNANVLNGAVRANVDVGQSNRRGTTLLGIDLNLGGGVGHRGW